MNIDLELLERYSPDGDIYESLKADYGKAAAEKVLQAFISGESGAVSEVLSDLSHGEKLNTSTTGILGEQLATDPLGAPLDAAGKVADKVAASAFIGILKSPALILAVAIVLGLYFRPILAPVFKRLLK